MDDAKRSDEERHQREVWAPDPGKEEEANAAYAETGEQLEKTSLEGTETGRSLEEIRRGVERAAEQPGYGREAE